MAEKIRKVIGKAVTCQSFPGAPLFLADVGINYNQVSTGTECEIVALVEPEPAIVQPEGAVWKRSGVYNYAFDLTHNGIVIAHIMSSRQTSGHAYRFRWDIHNGSGYSNTLEFAKQSAEEALADGSSHGFYWNPKNSTLNQEEKNNG